MILKMKRYSFRNKTNAIKLEKLQESAKRKQNRLKRQFDIDIDIDYKGFYDIKNKKEFNDYINKLENFTDIKNYRYVKNKNDLAIPRETFIEIQNVLKDVNKLKEKRYNEIKDINFTSFGNETAETINDRKLMGDVRYNEFKKQKFNFNTFRSEKEINDYLNSLKKKTKKSYYRFRNKQLKQNYIKSLNNVFNENEKTKELIKKIEKMSIKKFMQLFYKEDIIDFSYQYTEEQAQLALNNILNVVSKF